MKLYQPTDRMLQGARDYAASDRSDPFSFVRCMTHIRLGLGRPTPQGEDGHYAADAYQEERSLPDGRTYHATVYRNAKRI